MLFADTIIGNIPAQKISAGSGNDTVMAGGR